MELALVAAFPNLLTMSSGPPATRETPISLD